MSNILFLQKTGCYLQNFVIISTQCFIKDVVETVFRFNVYKGNSIFLPITHKPPDCHHFDEITEK